MELPKVHNISDDIPNVLPEEEIRILLERPGVRLERIVSQGQITPEGRWYDQETDEWVMLVQGEARLEFADGSKMELRSGDYLLLAAHCRHRVAWTSREPACIWLALHTSPTSAT